MENTSVRYCACGCGGVITSKRPQTKYLPGHCSRDPKIRELQTKKMMETNMERYGETTCFKTKEFREKVEKHNLEKYGFKVASKSDIVKQHTMDSNMQKYGVKHIFQREDVKEKTKETNIEKYGDECAFRNADVQKRYTETCIKKYGKKHPSQTKEFQEKVRATNLEVYGCVCALNNEEVHSKTVQTNIERYGDAVPIRTESIKQKIKDTNLEKYGHEYPTQTEEVLQKIKDTNLDRYGYEFTTQVPEFKDKKIQTNLERYGYKTATECADVMEKVRKTNIEKFGVDCVFKRPDILEKFKELAWNRILRNKHWIPQFTKEQFFENGWINDGTYHTYPFKCVKCGAIRNLNREMCLCQDCYGTAGCSSFEKEIIEYLKTLNITDIQAKNRSILNKNHELDIYIPSKNLAIEFDGLYWHSEVFINSCEYHLNKTEQCLEKGIQLIHIFEDEWVNNSDIIKDRIKSSLGIHDHVVYARKCEIRNVEHHEMMKFLEANHLQGFVNCKYAYGLYNNNELVSIMTFGSYRINTGRKSVDGEYELLRFCNKIGYHIPGAASKLLKRFEHDVKPTKLISYCDRRWSNGNVYEKIGFKRVRNTDVNYWYVRNLNRENRFKYRKSELQKLLKDFDPELTERDNMINNGYHVIYDCGSILFEKTYVAE